MGVNQLLIAPERGGKTTFFRKKLLGKINDFAPVIIMDVKGYDYKDFSDMRVSNPRRLPQAIKYFQREWDNYGDRYPVIRYCPDFGMPKSDSAIAEMDKFIAGVDSCLNVSPYVWYVIEEQHNFSDGHGYRSGKQSKLMRQGQSHGIGSVQISQKPYDFPDQAYSGASTCYCARAKKAPDRLKDNFTDISMSDLRNLDRFYFYEIPLNPYDSERLHEPVNL